MCFSYNSDSSNMSRGTGREKWRKEALQNKAVLIFCAEKLYVLLHVYSNFRRSINGAIQEVDDVLSFTENYYPALYLVLSLFTEYSHHLLLSWEKYLCDKA